MAPLQAHGFWEGAFLNSLARMGRSAVAIDLRGKTGDASEVGQELSYLAVILREVEGFDTPPTVIAHSLGCPSRTKASRSNEDCGPRHARAGARDAEVDEHAAKVAFESLWAAFEAHVPTPVVPAFVLGVPSLVVAGAEDRLIFRLASVRTALYHGAEYRTEDELGHFMQTPGRAEFIVDWLEQKKVVMPPDKLGGHRLLV